MPLNYEQKSPSEYVYTPSGEVYSVGCDRRCKLIFVRSERFFRTPPCALILYVEFFYSPLFIFYQSSLNGKISLSRFFALLFTDFFDFTSLSSSSSS